MNWTAYNVGWKYIYKHSLDSFDVVGSDQNRESPRVFDAKLTTSEL
jgi:hypothetical protein